MLKAIAKLVVAILPDPATQRTGGDVSRTTTAHYQELLDKAKQEKKSVDEVILQDLASHGIKPGENVTVITRDGTYKIR